MYKALYRVWRPQSFQDVVGQPFVTKTLKNAIVASKVSHAYLFTGPRGTGKTSAAKIFAKAINCLNQKDGEPCNACETCLEITQGSLGDVIEIDAASNNGVEEVRDIRDKSRYAPTKATYKVYIIDEVHMLSTGAFNALLKTLEEPTSNVVFILATTEVHKIPPTILSRVQRFDFTRITTQHIEDRLAYILQEEKIDYEPKALSVVARCAKGGMRDALSLLDQVISFSDGKILYEDVLQISGTVSYQSLANYLVHLANHDTTQALQQLQTMLFSGKEAKRLIEELLSFCRDSLLYQATKNAELAMIADVWESIQHIEANFYYQFIPELAQTQQLMKLSTQSDVYLEMVTMKMAQQESAPSQSLSVSNGEIDAMKQQIANLQEQLAKLSGEASTMARTPKVDKREKVIGKTAIHFEPNLAAIFKVLAKATVQDKKKLVEDWQDITSVLSVSQAAKLRTGTVLAASPEGVVVGFDYEMMCGMITKDMELNRVVSEAIQKVSGHPGNIQCVANHQWREVRGRFLQVKEANQLASYLSSDRVNVINEPSQGIDEALEIEEEEQDIPEIVSKATELFGNIVEVMEEK